MIRLSLGSDVLALLDRVTASPERYKQVTICVPYIDDAMVKRLVVLAVAARRTQCGIQVVTTSVAAAALRAALPGHPSSWHDLVICRPGLHAKVYVSIARGQIGSEAIVTSANLTKNGTSKNAELGLRVLTSCTTSRQLFDEIAHFVRNIAA